MVTHVGDWGPGLVDMGYHYLEGGVSKFLKIK